MSIPEESSSGWNESIDEEHFLDIFSPGASAAIKENRMIFPCFIFHSRGFDAPIIPSGNRVIVGDDSEKFAIFASKIIPTAKSSSVLMIVKSLFFAGLLPGYPASPTGSGAVRASAPAFPPKNSDPRGR